MDALHWTQNRRAEMLRLAWPIAVSMVSYSLMTLVDAMLVGHLGAFALAGVGLGGTAAFAVLCFTLGLLRGAKTLISQAVGARRPDEVNAYLGACLVWALAAGVVSLVLGELIALALPLLSATEAAGAAARTYLGVRALGMPLASLHAALREVRYGQGDSRSPMIAALIANALNIALAATLIYGFDLGVVGAAWATIVAQAAEAALVARVQPGLVAALRTVTRRHVANLWEVGLPTAIQFALEVGAFVMLTAMVSSLSETQMAAHQIAIQVIHFSFLPAFAVGESASVMVGQAVGGGRDELVGGVARDALALAALYTGACTIVLALGAPLIAASFTSNPEVRAMAVRLLYVAAVFQVFDGANIVGRGTLRGTGDVRSAAWVGVLSSWACTPPLMWLLGYRAGLGAFGGWLGLCAEIIVATLLVWLRVERGGWRARAALSRSLVTQS